LSCEQVLDIQVEKGNWCKTNAVPATVSLVYL